MKSETEGTGAVDHPATRAFVEYRDLLFTVAYQMLGSATDAEDVLQESWLQWSRVAFDEIRDPRAYLVKITTRQALMRLRSLGRRKESYVGPWLPEPLLTAPDVAEDVELAESISMAMLLVLETLSPVERAVFVLREVFDVPHAEIAGWLDKSEQGVRQIAHRARRRVAQRRPRGDVRPVQVRDAMSAFQDSVRTGDLQRLLDVLAPDVVLLTDGGGVVRAAVDPVVGAEAVAEVVGRLSGGATIVRPIEVNAHPALLILEPDSLGSVRPHTVLAFRFDDGLVSGMYAVRNPAKLTTLTREAVLRR